MSYSTHTTKTYSYSSSSGQPAQRRVTETRTYTDADGTRRTETVTHGGDGSVDGLGQRMDSNLNIGRRIVPSQAPSVESRYSTYSRGQNHTYAQIVDRCRRSGKLFEDETFDAVDSNVFTSRRPPRPFVWKRPSEICSDPQLFVGGASRFDVVQGMLGDCWLLAAVAALTQNKSMLQRVVPDDQGFGQSEYTGCFRFNFWQGGEWTEVVIDDRLPTVNNKLVFMHSESKNEFWSALLEKAYAKLCGSYEALKGGQTSEALTDFTGGISESHAIEDCEKNGIDLFKLLHKAMAKGALMGCSITASPNEIEAKLDNGLVKGHAYSITAVKKVTVRTRSTEGLIPMLRIRNPWGNEREWKGAWSDGSREWGLMDDNEKRQIGLTFEDDGEFWMSFKDFKENFTTVEICHLSAEGVDDGIRWCATTEKGSWRRCSTAGGCRNFINTFHTNPQFRVSVNDTDDDEDDKGTLMIGLMQVNRRKLKRKLGEKANLTIGFAIYKPEGDDKGIPLDKEYFMYHASTARSSTFINSREIVNQFLLPPGDYVIVPSTFDPNQEGDFILRLYTEKPNDAKEVDTVTEYKPKAGNRNDVTPRPVEDTLDSKFSQFFDQIAGKDGAVDAFELQRILEAAFKKDLDRQFSLEGCRSLIASEDINQTGKLDYEEFKEVFMKVKGWHKQFTKYDADRSGSMDMYELRAALKDLGIALSRHALTSVTCRFASKDGKLLFDDFAQIVCKLENLLDVFNRRKQGRIVSFSLDEFIQESLNF